MKLNKYWITTEIFLVVSFVVLEYILWVFRPMVGNDLEMLYAMISFATMLSGILSMLELFYGDAYCVRRYLSEKDVDIELHEYRNKTIISYKGWVYEFYLKKKDPSLSGRVVTLIDYHNIKKKFLRTEVINYK